MPLHWWHRGDEQVRCIHAFSLPWQWFSVHKCDERGIWEIPFALGDLVRMLGHVPGRWKLHVHGHRKRGAQN
jgi:hypothetical protein